MQKKRRLCFLTKTMIFWRKIFYFEFTYFWPRCKMYNFTWTKTGYRNSTKKHFFEIFGWILQAVWCIKNLINLPHVIHQPELIPRIFAFFHEFSAKNWTFFICILSTFFCAFLYCKKFYDYCLISCEKIDKI